MVTALAVLVVGHSAPPHLSCLNTLPNSLYLTHVSLIYAIFSSDDKK